LDEKPIHNDLDRVTLPLVQRGKVIKRIEISVDAHADVAVLSEFLQLLAIRALSPANDGRKDHDAVVPFADFPLQDGLHDLLAGLARDGLVTIRTVRHADRRVDHAQIIVNLGDGDRKSTRLNSSHALLSRMPSSA